MSNFDENVVNKLKRLEQAVERLKVWEQPVGSWTAWVPTETGWTGLPTGVYRYCRVGSLITCSVAMTAGTSDATSAELSLPFTSANIAGVLWGGALTTWIDNGTEGTVAGRWYITANSSTVIFNTSFNNGIWTASGSKRVYAVFTYEAA